MGLSIACGGGGSSTPSSTPVDDASNIQPTPLPHLKQVFQLTQPTGKSSRYSEEVTESAPGRFKTTSFLYGLYSGNSQYEHTTINGNAYIQTIIENEVTTIFANPGLRQWFEDNEFPFTQSLSVLLDNNRLQKTSAPLIWTEHWTKTGERNFNLAGQNLLGREVYKEWRLEDSAGNLLSASNIHYLQHQTYGNLETSWTYGSSQGAKLVLTASHTGDDLLFYRQGSLLKKTNENFNLDLSSSLINAPEEHLRELYDIGLSLTEIPANSTISPTWVQALSLYHQYYLYPQVLPTSLVGITSLENYVNLLDNSDPFTYYFPKSINEILTSQSEGSTSHMGINLELSDGSQLSSGKILTSQLKVRIKSVESLSRAYFDGLQVGDLIVSINGNVLQGINSSAIAVLLPNTEESNVSFGIERANQNLNISSASEENMSWTLGSNILYLNVRQFTDLTGKHVVSDVKKFSSSDYKKVILDLRGNGGGRLSGALELLDFLGNFDQPNSSNIMFSTQPYNDQYYFGSYNTEQLRVQGGGNVVILMDQNSASASEIVAGVLQLYGAATIMGSKSYGKGVGQSTFTLIDGSGLWVTSLGILLRGTYSYHVKGIIPNYLVTGAPTLSNDPVLESAKLFLQGQSFAHLQQSKATLHEEQGLSNWYQFWLDKSTWY